MFRSDVTLLGSDGGALEAELAALDKDEAVVAIGFLPYSRELGLVVDVARRRGVPVLSRSSTAWRLPWRGMPT